mmetsp:Transcript_19589/g.22520  ORF Transcript_19589/g.22520 Transcript_19589/m.22520 type:complete len:1448 (+) Transcript_19589:302-4645(+)
MVRLSDGGGRRLKNLNSLVNKQRNVDIRDVRVKFSTKTGLKFKNSQAAPTPLNNNNAANDDGSDEDEGSNYEQVSLNGSSRGLYGNSNSNNNNEVDLHDVRLNVYDEYGIGKFACRIMPQVKVSPRTIGGDNYRTLIAKGSTNSRNNSKQSKKTRFAEEQNQNSNPLTILQNECLLCMRVNRFDLNHTASTGVGSALTSIGGDAGFLGKNAHTGGTAVSSSVYSALNKKNKHKPRYVCVLRSTNRRLLEFMDEEESGSDGNNSGTDEDEDEDEDGDGGYDTMYSPDPVVLDEDGACALTNASMEQLASPDRDSTKKPKKKKRRARNKQQTSSSNLLSSNANTISPEDEMSSFPAIVFMTLHADGSSPEIRKVMELDQLSAIESINQAADDPNRPAGAPSPLQAQQVHLRFRNGDAVEIDCELPESALRGLGTDTLDEDLENSLATKSTLSKYERRRDSLQKKTTAQGSADAGTRRDKFLWGLLQIHSILCTSVVDRHVLALETKYQQEQSASSNSKNSRYLQNLNVHHNKNRSVVGKEQPLPPLILRHVDQTELQYLSTVNGFLSESKPLTALLERQRHRHGKPKDTAAGATRTTMDVKEALSLADDDVAYDGMMRQQTMTTTTITIFTSVEEEKDAEEILNGYYHAEHSATTLTATSAKQPTDDADTSASDLTQSLQKRMRDLEVDACRRLIAWEDEKQQTSGLHDPPNPASASQPPAAMNPDAMSLVSLFATLDQLDAELVMMEEWLTKKATAIQPLTDDCRDIEEENKALEQQWKSYDMLGNDMSHIFSGLDLKPDLERVMKDPRSALIYSKKRGQGKDKIDVVESESGVDVLHQAGEDLYHAIECAAESGGVHLKAVNGRVKHLISKAELFCAELKQIVIEVMKQLASEIVPSADGIKKTENHTSMARQIRDTQRKYQSSLLGFIKLIEIVSKLQPETLVSIRDEYAQIVVDGILSKKRMKIYFLSLPGYNNDPSVAASPDLRDYQAASLKASSSKKEGVLLDHHHHGQLTVNAEDIGCGLSELLPVIAREAYFTAALFGLSKKQHLDGREKKRNFEQARKSVDTSSYFFRYYLQRVCGIFETETGKLTGETMLSLVASIHLNESMEGYIDHQKKGGDHSLSLAYVRATILDFRKKVDKNWVGWVEDNIKYIRSNTGVPLNGKRAGVFPSFARFPTYLDHVLQSCQAGRGSDYKVNLSKIRVISYYLQKMAGALFASLHECAERDTTDKQYASNVMRMENSYFFLESIRRRGDELMVLFQKQFVAANAIFKQSTDAYLGWMIKREFKQLHVLFSNISRIRKDVGDKDVPIHVPKSTFIKTLAKETSRDILKERIVAMYERMEKHLSETANFLPLAWKALVRMLYDWFNRWEKMSFSCYNYKLEPSPVEIVRLAKTKVGAVKKTGGGGATLNTPTAGATTASATNPNNLNAKPGGDENNIGKTK